MKRSIYLSIGLIVLINLVQAFFTPIADDEAYYWVWSQNLAWGYFDHPPTVAWWGGLGYQLFQNELGFRLLTVLMNGCALWILYEIFRPQTKSQRNVFWVLMGSVLVFSMFGWITTPDAPLLFFTVFYLFSLKQFIQKESVLSMVLLSIALAGLMYSKYHGILVIVFTLLPMLWNVWKRPKFYGAVLLSLLLYSPHLYWLLQHDFVPFQYHFSERSADETFEWNQLLTYFVIYFLGAAPLLSYFVFKAMVQFKPEDAFQRSVQYLAILPGVFFFLMLFKDKVQPQWLLISFVGMTILVYEFYKEKEINPWFFRLGWLSVLLVLLVRIGLVVPSVSPFEKNKQFAKELKAFDLDQVVFEKYQEASVFLFYNPEKQATTHRTIGNRRSQYSLWNWEDGFQHQTIQYVSPWVRSDRSFVGGRKNYTYYIKEIPDYLTYHLLEIETESSMKTGQNDEVQLKIRIYNGHEHAVNLGEDSLLQLNATYYQDKQYELLYSPTIKLEDLTLEAGETKNLTISFRNIDQKGVYKVCIGVNYAPIGTTYLSTPIDWISD